MKAAVLEQFQKPLTIREMPDPSLTAKGAIVRVEANGICRSDWHAWMGDWDWLGMNLPLPHVLGHEFTGVVEEVGAEITRFQAGDRVIVPFSQGDGTCPMCLQGHQNICDHAKQPGFSYWGGLGRYVHVPNADANLIELPENVDFTEGASLGCRFMTAFHGLTEQVKVQPGEWVAIHGCGGVGLSAIQIVAALGAHAIAIDIADDKLAFAKALGAEETINARNVSPQKAIKELTKGGADVSVDALGIAATCQASILSLRKRGRHLQIGMTSRMEQGMIPLPIDLIVNFELNLAGSLGMPARQFPQMLKLVADGRLKPGALVTRTVPIEEAGNVIASMSDFATTGVTVVTNW